MEGEDTGMSLSPIGLEREMSFILALICYWDRFSAMRREEEIDARFFPDPQTHSPSGTLSLRPETESQQSVSHVS